MRASNANSIRQLLRANPDGLDVSTIANAVDREPGSVRTSLKAMPDVYIDRWEKQPRGFGVGYTAIWCIVTPPDHCPHPAKQVVAVRQSGRKTTGENAPIKNEKSKHND